MADTQNDKGTKDRILDSAEKLFAIDGYKGTSMRAITGKASVNLASVNYHFGSKKGLLDAVIKRRIVPLNKIRKQRLEDVRRQAREAGKKADVSSILRAFIEPTLRFMDSDPGARDFIALIGRSMSDPDDTVRNIFHRYIISLFNLFFEMMSEALPELKKDVLFWRIHFAIGSLQHTMRICGTNFKELEHFNTDTDTLTEYLLEFITEGVKA
ncbi:MAG: TetR family transcriptional regulator [Thermodesulfovibrionales bacterium]